MKRLEVPNGSRFGKLTVIEDAPTLITPSGQVRRRMLCKCDCGKLCVVALSNLTTNKTQSCGCQKIESATRHGQSRSRTYHIWRGMVKRATGKYCREYYADRGITCDPRWLDLNNFLIDMGHAPENLSLDRVNNNEGYSKKNCRWATRKEQARNKRSNRIIDFRGDKLCFAALVEKYGIPKNTLSTRLREGWTLEKALFTPVQRGKTLSYKGETLSVAHFAKRYGMSPNALSARLKMGWDTEKALTEPLHK